MAADREVVDAVVAPEHRGPSADFRKALGEWPGTFYWGPGAGRDRVTLIRARQTVARERWWLHLLLFAVTFFTVWLAGDSLFSGTVRLLSIPAGGLAVVWSGILDWATHATPALGFATALMAILLVHELGHYLLARRYVINASPPYFLPAPWMVNFIGTFGAFIRLRSPIVDRRQLFDVGAAGPWAGLAVAVAVLLFGLSQSQVFPGDVGLSPQFILWGGQRIYIGDSLLMRLSREAVLGPGLVLLHPLALAGWFGLFVTMLNLIPLGQLDGGHVVYALIGKHQAKIGLIMFYALIPLGLQFRGWWLWAAMILVLGRGRIAHPSVMDPHTPIPASRWAVGLATAAVFILTFVADPFPSFW